MKFDYLIVGAGYAGAVIAERIASQLDKKVLIVDKRNHIGGNAYDYYNEHGLLIHKYGPHIFHTKSSKVWNYLSGFTSWLPYYHHVLAVIEGKKVPVPFNFNSIYQLFPANFAARLENLLLDKFSYGLKIPILKLMESNDSDLKFLAEYVYENVFKGYTMKQWGLKPEELDFSVTSRVPVYLSRDNRYFQDQYQGIPGRGYTEMFNRMLANDNIHIMLKTDYKDIVDDIKFNKMVYTGPVDFFFDNMHGELPYRSLSFDLKSYRKDQFQETAQVNYPNNHNYTRITEFRHFTDQKSDFTTVAYEYPEEYLPGNNDPYYPVPNDENHVRYEQYRKETEKLKDSVIFTGRLAEYKYYNMDEIVAVALMIFKNRIA